MRRPPCLLWSRILNSFLGERFADSSRLLVRLILDGISANVVSTAPLRYIN